MKKNKIRKESLIEVLGLIEFKRSYGSFAQNLVKGSIRKECFNLINNLISKDQKLHEEYPYSKIIDIEGDDRLILVITENENPSIIIAILIIDENTKALYNEFQKISILKNTNNTPNYFILLVSEKIIPSPLFNVDVLTLKGLFVVNYVEFMENSFKTKSNTKGYLTPTSKPKKRPIYYTKIIEVI